MIFQGDSQAPSETVVDVQSSVKEAFDSDGATDASVSKLVEFCSSGSSETVLEELRLRFKHCPERSQMQFLSIVDRILQRLGKRFAVLISTEKWTERFFRVAKTSTLVVRDRILILSWEWLQKYRTMGLERLAERFTESKVLGDQFKKIRGPGVLRKVETHADPEELNRRRALKNQLLSDEETFLLQAEGDLACLEYLIETPEVVQDADVAKECRHHKQQCMRMLESGIHSGIDDKLMSLIERLSNVIEIYEALTGTDLGEGAKSRAKAAEDGECSGRDSDDEAYMDRLRKKGMSRVDPGIAVVRAQKQTQALMNNERLQTNEWRDKFEKLQCQHEELKLKYKESKEKNKSAVAKLVEMDKQLQAGVSPVPVPVVTSKKPENKVNLEQLRATASKIRGELLAVRQGVREIKTKHAADIASTAEYYVVQLNSAVAALGQAGDEDRQADKKALQWTQELYKKEMQLRKLYYNQIQELRGNIRVYCRVRPLLPFEKSAGRKNIMKYPADGEISFMDSSDRPKRYEFDQVYNPETSQERVFEDTAPLIDSVVDGYNVCIFAYGQTGSGKTFTMGGGGGDEGINTRALQRLFTIIETRKESEKSTVSISVLEIYCEQIRDLLAGSDSSLTYEVKQGGPFGTYVTNLSEVPVGSAKEIDRILDQAQKNRSQGKTNMNEYSSRSHMVLYIIVRTTNNQTGLKSYGKLSLIDLAGSERLDKSGVTGQLQKEAVFINKSLSSLGDVISDLSQNSKHIPYRNSILTYLLQDSMGGQAKVLMFVCVGPADYNASESGSSLLFASRARGCALGQVKKNEVK